MYSERNRIQQVVDEQQQACWVSSEMEYLLAKWEQMKMNDLSNPSCRFVISTYLPSMLHARLNLEWISL